MRRGFWAFWGSALLGLAFASCVPSERVPEWRTTDLKGILGTAGYHYRVQKAELLCRILPDLPLRPLPVMLAYYVDLPRGLGMVEYLASPEDLLPPEDGEGPRVVPTQTVLFLGDLSSAEARAAAEKILKSGEVEIVLMDPELSVPEEIAKLLPRVPMVFRYAPGVIPRLLEKDGAVLDLDRLGLVSLYFLGQSQK